MENFGVSFPSALARTSFGGRPDNHTAGSLFGVGPGLGRLTVNGILAGAAV